MHRVGPQKLLDWRLYKKEEWENNKIEVARLYRFGNLLRLESCITQRLVKKIK